MSATVEAAMTDRVLGIVPEATLDTALRMMAQARVRHLPVITNGRCVGLLTESDALWHAWASGDASCSVTEVMRTPTPSVDLAVPLPEAAAAVLESGADAVVVTSAGAVVGILTSADLVRVVSC
ncbi:CBS domain-containing protein [Actinokineospora sp. 24-640]